jgi:hypothetical protein
MRRISFSCENQNWNVQHLLVEKVLAQNSSRQYCGFGMFIPDPDFFPFRIQQRQQERGIFEQAQKNISANKQRTEVFFTQIVASLALRNIVKDPRSGIRDLGSRIRKKKLNPDPGIKKVPDPGSATLVLE